MSKQSCPTCGAPTEMSWSGLDLVANTGDETLAEKHYTYQPENNEAELDADGAKKKQLELAVAQFTGWHHAKSNGNRIIELVESMGLTAEEWHTLRRDVMWLNDSDKHEIDTHFQTRC